MGGRRPPSTTMFFDINALLLQSRNDLRNHPKRTVVAHPSLTLAEKRAILAFPGLPMLRRSLRALRLRAPEGLKNAGEHRCYPWRRCCADPWTGGPPAIRRGRKSRSAVSSTARAAWRALRRTTMDDIRLPRHVIDRVEQPVGRAACYMACRPGNGEKKADPLPDAFTFGAEMFATNSSGRQAGPRRKRPLPSGLSDERWSASRRARLDDRARRSHWTILDAGLGMPRARPVSHGVDPSITGTFFGFQAVRDLLHFR